MKIHILIYLTVGIVTIISCQPKALNIRPSYNKGGFTMSHFQAKSKNSIVVFGQIKDIETNEIIRSAIVKMGCTTVQSDDSGTYKISGESITSKSFLTCSFIGYRTVETERFKLETGDSLKVDFFLVQDDRPMINCEGQD
jgi:hypothetical protein